MDRLKEFICDGKNFFSIDFSGIRGDSGYAELIEAIKPLVANYPKNSLYTITNIGNIRYDSDTKKIALDLLNHNKPYVKYAAIFGVDGIKKMLVMALMKLCGRKNIFFAFSREKAIEILLQQE